MSQNDSKSIEASYNTGIENGPTVSTLLNCHQVISFAGRPKARVITATTMMVGPKGSSVSLHFPTTPYPSPTLLPNWSHVLRWKDASTQIAIYGCELDLSSQRSC
ncbi:unnamed protein product [Lactuca virosa]|uniref:Uncharacterized protein n=1 Tax=Lactuca virosa TaxID=75947 RepID=A0AAU9PUY3_9ASTR|nr:unnamed protein product [Lactuca virosa]